MVTQSETDILLSGAVQWGAARPRDPSATPPRCTGRFHRQRRPTPRRTVRRGAARCPPPWTRCRKAHGTTRRRARRTRPRRCVVRSRPRPATVPCHRRRASHRRAASASSAAASGSSCRCAARRYPSLRPTAPRWSSSWRRRMTRCPSRCCRTPSPRPTRAAATFSSVSRISTGSRCSPPKLRRLGHPRRTSSCSRCRATCPRCRRSASAC